MFSLIWSNWPKYQGRPTHFRCKNSGKPFHQNLCLLLKCEMSALVLVVKIKLQHIHTHTLLFLIIIYICIYVYACILAVYYKCTYHIYPLSSFVRIEVHASRWSSWRVLRLVWATQESGSMAKPWKPTSLKTQTKIPRKHYRNTRFLEQRLMNHRVFLRWAYWKGQFLLRGRLTEFGWRSRK